VLSWFSQAMGPTMAALYCAVGPEEQVSKVRSIQGSVKGRLSTALKPYVDSTSGTFPIDSFH
jgi:hypothetical protein